MHTYYHDGQLTGNECRRMYTHFSNAVFVILDTKFVMDINQFLQRKSQRTESETIILVFH
jgi:hypothetical protein